MRLQVYLQKKLGKVCFQHDNSWEVKWDFKNLPRRTASARVLRDKAHKIASNSKYDKYQLGPVPMVFDEKPRDTTTHAETEIFTEDQQLTNALHKPITTKIQRWKVYPSYQDNIWDADLADLQVISKYSGLSILQWVININKYA